MTTKADDILSEELRDTQSKCEPHQFIWNVESVTRMDVDVVDADQLEPLFAQAMTLCPATTLQVMN